MQAGKQAVKVLTRRTVHYLEKDPEKNFGKLLKAAKVMVKIKAPCHLNAVKDFQRMWEDQTNPWHSYFSRYLTWLNEKQRVKVATNFLINGSVVGYTKQLREAEELGCNIPWAILMDPTSACNLKCTGCWAAEYEKQDNLTFEEMDDIVRQGRELGCFFYIFPGGEPLIRKKDLIRLCEKNDDCAFAAFTNGTLIDEAFAAELRRVGNFVPILSIEGFEEVTDMRRGAGTFQKVVRAMDILRENRLAFGFSCCYHSKNTDVVSNDEFIDFMIEKGAWFGWYFTFIPVGSDAPLDLIVTPEQREHMYRRINEIRAKKPIFVLDFWNDGQYCGGCIAGGRRYFHINASGDAEPCAFIHYSDSSIREKPILDILKSPLFMAYHHGQPFNENMLRPCPLLDNPDRLRAMVQSSGAHSTQPLDPEKVEDLTSKCASPSQKWARTADRIWYDELSHSGEERSASKASCEAGGAQGPCEGCAGCGAVPEKAGGSAGRVN
ncbi:MAG: radical SAM protein [Clostridia bacterium]|nr:radical SAM protein [Clostridia bacterium]